MMPVEMNAGEVKTLPHSSEKAATAENSSTEHRAVQTAGTQLGEVIQGLATGIGDGNSTTDGEKLPQQNGSPKHCVKGSVQLEQGDFSTHNSPPSQSYGTHPPKNAVYVADVENGFIPDPTHQTKLDAGVNVLVFEDISMDGDFVETPSRLCCVNDLKSELVKQDVTRTDHPDEELSFSGILSPKENSKVPTKSRGSINSVDQLETDSLNSDEQPASNEGTRSNKPKRRRENEDVMEHSGLEATIKRPCVAMNDKAMLCLRLEGISKDSPAEMVVPELVRCMHEMWVWPARLVPKSVLITDVVRVLGVEKALQLFEETVAIQRNGGQLTADGQITKTPGGVFLTLVKKNITLAQKKEIFKRDQQIVAQRRKEDKHRRFIGKQKKQLQRKAESELQMFRAQLKPEHRHDLNMDKRLFGTTKEKQGEKLEGDSSGRKNTSVFSRLGHKRDSTEVAEAMEVESTAGLAPRRKDRGLQRLRDATLIPAEEQLAAEEFEQMNECDLDFGIDLS